MVLIVMVIEGKLLLALGGVIGVIKVEHNGRRRLCVTGNESVHEGSREPIEVFPIYLMFQTRQGRGTRSILGRLQGGALHSECE
jgi:hypothetical protein